MNLGLVATGKRSIKSGDQYRDLFTDQVQNKETELMADGDVYDTLKQMKRIVNDTLPQTEKIATRLKGSSINETCKNLWEFLYHHVQYKKDNPLREQLRTPARTWKDRRTGVDCDCYSIFISSVLTNLKIPHAFRMAGYKGDFQHVYVVVPGDGKSISSNRSSYYVIDPVVNRYNYEAPFNKKHDQKMSQVTMLNGFDGGNCNPKPEILRLRYFVDTQEVVDRGGVPTLEFLIENNIPYVPSFDQKSDRSVYIVQTPGGFLAIPTVLSPSQAEQLKKVVGTCAANTPAPGSGSAEQKAADLMEQFKKKFNWWWLLIAAGVWILFTGSDQSEVKSGLSGVDNKGKKLKTISI